MANNGRLEVLILEGDFPRSFADHLTEEVVIWYEIKFFELVKNGKYIGLKIVPTSFSCLFLGQQI